MRVMKKACVLVICLALSVCSNAEATLIIYSVYPRGAGEFEYEYTLINNTLETPIKQFTIWFDLESYDNLVITTGEPLVTEWSEIILEETGFGLPIGYDALAVGTNTGIPPDEDMSVSGFSVGFDWLGTGIPGPQFFQIIDPFTLQTIDSGYTIPEPAAFLTMGLAALYILRRRRS
jgi:hypothetical protein